MLFEFLKFWRYRMSSLFALKKKFLQTVFWVTMLCDVYEY